MSRAEVTKAADYIQESVFRDGGSIRLSREGNEFLDDHIDRSKLKELSKELEHRGILGAVIVDGLKDHLEERSFGMSPLLSTVTEMLQPMDKEALSELADYSSADVLTKVAASAAAERLDDDETLTEDTLEDIEKAYISDELLKMFPDDESWRKLAGEDDRLYEDELKEQIKNPDWTDKQQDILERLLKYYDDFESLGNIMLEDVRDMKEETADVALEYEDPKSPYDKSSDELIDVLEDKDTTIEEKLAAVERLSEMGHETITLTDSNGNEVTCKIVVEPVSPGNNRKYVHLKTTDDGGTSRIILRAISEDGKYEKQQDSPGHYVDYVGSWWAKKHPDSAISS